MKGHNARTPRLQSVIPGQIASVTNRVKLPQVEALVDAILQADTVFTAGAGRSLLILKAFTMRLVHLGMKAYAVGETSTPAIGSDDLLIAGSGSGVTRTTLAIVEAAKERGARVATITANPKGPIPQASDMIVEIPWPVTKVDTVHEAPQPPGSLFEQCMFVVCEDMIMQLMRKLGTSAREMRERHTKLE
ncbi:MAG: 6-phospho-3-hexuloisomerase [Armatimonadota bacterium]